MDKLKITAVLAAIIATSAAEAWEGVEVDALGNAPSYNDKVNIHQGELVREGRDIWFDDQWGVQSRGTVKSMKKNSDGSVDIEIKSGWHTNTFRFDD